MTPTRDPLPAAVAATFTTGRSRSRHTADSRDE